MNKAILTHHASSSRNFLPHIPQQPSPPVLTLMPLSANAVQTSGVWWIPSQPRVSRADGSDRHQAGRTHSIEEVLRQDFAKPAAGVSIRAAESVARGTRPYPPLVPCFATGLSRSLPSLPSANPAPPPARIAPASSPIHSVRSRRPPPPPARRSAPLSQPAARPRTCRSPAAPTRRPPSGCLTPITHPGRRPSPNPRKARIPAPSTKPKTVTRRIAASDCRLRT